MKKPLLVWIFAIGMIFSPLGNIILNMYAYKWSNPLSPESWFFFVKQINGFDLTWLILTSLSGMLLFIQRKTTWLFAISLLSLLLCMNVFRFFTMEIQLPRSFWGGIIGLSIVLPSILYQMRFPYIERRESLLQINKRTQVHLNAQFQISSEEYQCVLKNISRSGGLIELPSESIEIKVGEECLLQFEKFAVPGKVVRLHGKTEVGLRWSKKIISSDLSKFIDRAAIKV